MFPESNPYLRRIIRFFLLPYCYFKLVPWGQCRRGKIQVLSDLLYIFFKLKYFPGNYGLCRFWEKERKDWAFFYGASYDPYQRQRLRRLVQRYEYQIVFNDKALCEQFCQGLSVAMPRFFGNIKPNSLYRDQLEDYFAKNGDNDLFIKPAMGHAGQGILKAVKKQNNIIIKTAHDEVNLSEFILTEKCIVQEAVCQHEILAKISPSSVNTIRIITLLTVDDKIILIGALIRFSKNESFIDNTSAGGIAVGIDMLRGELREIGYDFSGNIYSRHPKSGIVFAGFRIPKWQEMITMAESIQKQCDFYRLIGVDIAVTSNGPVLIEVNAAPDIIGIEQANGPILKNKKVFDEFKKYDLLINNYQMSLYD